MYEFGKDGGIGVQIGRQVFISKQLKLKLARQRKLALKEARAGVAEMWRSGDWPSALGLAIAMMNLESHGLPGADAAYVREATALLIKQSGEGAA